jgi:RNA polymerase-binding transcription factor DksA
MADAADMVVANDERAMGLLEEQLRRDRIAESMRTHTFDPHRLCVQCHEPIGEKRLRALANTGVCAACARLLEEHYGRMPFA